MKVSELQTLLALMPSDAKVILAVETQIDKNDDAVTTEKFAEHVILRPDRKVQIGDSEN